MAFYRATWHFQGFERSRGLGRSHRSSWSETWYVSANSLDHALRLATEQGIPSWLLLRTGILSRIYTVEYVTVSDELNPRSSKTANINLRGAAPENNSGVSGAAALFVSPPAQVTCALLVDFVRLPFGAGDIAHHARRLFRGLPQSLIQGNIINPDSPYVSRLVAFLSFLGRQEGPGNPVVINPTVPTWLIRNRDRANVSWVPITALANGPLGANTLRISAGLQALVTGERVKIRGVREPRGADRTWTVIDPPPGSPAGGPITLGTARREVCGVWSNAGYASRVRWDYGPADQYTIIGMRSRKTGRNPSSGSAGRRSRA